MKEAVLAVKDGDGSGTRKVFVKLTSEHLVIRDIDKTQSSGSLSETSAAIPSYSSVEKSSYVQQVTASVSSTDSSISKPSVDTPNKLDITSSKMPASDDSSGERVVTIQRQPGGGLGISVKGGAEHGIPVLISRVFPGQAADQTHLLHPGDAILAVNDKRVENMMHDDVVAELRSCGPQVSLTVRAFDGASHVLRTAASQSSATPSKGSVSSDQPNSPTDSTKLTPPTISTRESANSNNSSLALLPSPSTHESKSATDSLKGSYTSFKPDLNESTQLDSSVIKAHLREITIPLPFARLERYHEGSDVQRSDSFELIARDGTKSGLITCSDELELNEWIDAVSQETRQATMKQALLTAAVDLRLGHLSPQSLSLITLLVNTETDCDQEMASSITTAGPNHRIVYMGWISERPGVASVAQVVWKTSFVAVREEKIYFFDQPPTTEDDWAICTNVYALYESLIRAHVFPADVAHFEECVQRATHEAVFKLQSKSYPCTANARDCEFTVDFNDGFRLVDVSSQKTVWEYKFSQLKGSSDDGKSEVTFTFQNRTTEALDKQSFMSERAYPLLFCVHAFLAAKLSRVDPLYLEKKSVRARQLQAVASPQISLSNGDHPPPLS